MDLKKLKELTSKGYSEAFLSNKYVFRHITVYLSYLALKIGISANTLTFISMICAIIGAYMQVYSNLTLLTISNVLMFAYYILDMMDGEVARYNYHVKNISSGKAGAYFDALVHYLFTPVLFFALGVFSYQQYGSTAYLWVGLWTGMAFSSYSRSAANRVIFDAVLANGGDNEAINRIWQHDKINRSQASQKKKIRFVIKEIFSTQGQIFALIIFTYVDWYLVSEYSMRTVYLVLMAVIGLLNFPKTAYYYFKNLEQIA